MTEGNFGGGDLCSTSLYIHPTDNDGYGPSYCNPTAYYSNNAYGPTWSVSYNGPCPLDDPYYSFSHALLFIVCSMVRKSATGNLCEITAVHSAKAFHFQQQSQ